jgi:3'(2'), 5'-bisphosphate nucleotidase
LITDSDITPETAARLYDELTALVGQASAAILRFSQNTVLHEQKPDGSPVTAADMASEAVILRGLAALVPNVPVVSEESAGKETHAPAGCFILVDPLDGTREYVAGRDEYTVNLAIIRQGVPLLGIISAPAKGLMWRGLVGRGAQRLRLHGGTPGAAQTIKTRPWPKSTRIAAVSRSHLDPDTEAFLGRLEKIVTNESGSSIKFCRIGEGVVDVYPRLGRTCEWDIAAGHAIVTAAGGAVIRPDGTPLTYGSGDPNFYVPAFIAWGDPAKAQAM